MVSGLSANGRMNKDKDMDTGRDEGRYFVPEFSAPFFHLSPHPSYLFIENKIIP